MGVLGVLAWISFDLFMPAMVSSLDLIGETFVDQDFFLTNEQLALMAIARSRGTATTARMRAVFREQEPPPWGSAELDDLEAWGTQAGLEPERLQVHVEDVDLLPKPFVVFLKCREIAAVLDVKDDVVVLYDRFLGRRTIPRLDWDRRFTGQVLCFKEFVRPGTLLAPVRVAHSSQTTRDEVSRH